MKPSSAVEFSVKTILYEDFVWLYENTADEEELKLRIERRLERTEKNRIESVTLGKKNVRNV